jgi:hypothetical protein
VGVVCYQLCRHISRGKDCFQYHCFPDYNVLLTVEGEELSPEIRAMGFPIEHKHKLCCLRQELLDSFVE